MSPVLKKSVFLAVPALIGVAGFYAWKTRSSPPDAATAPSPAVRHTQASLRVAAPASLNSVTDPGQAWQVRVALLRNALRSECGEPEIRYLYELLAKGPPKGELPEHWYVIANEFMEQLLSHDADSERLSTNLLRLLQDARQPLVLRDYAVISIRGFVRYRFLLSCPCFPQHPLTSNCHSRDRSAPPHSSARSVRVPRHDQSGLGHQPRSSNRHG